MASSLRSLLLSAAPAGSDHQLAYARSFAGVATSAADLEFLSGLLDGTVGARRARRGHRPALDPAAPPGQPRACSARTAIDAELSADATDAGERQAAACRAAVPDRSRRSGRRGRR